MVKIILHIGSTKTGSSAIQTFLFVNREKLKGAGLLYPNVGIASNAHHVLAAAVHPNAHCLHREQLPDGKEARLNFFAEMMADVRNEADTSGCQVVLISSEYFWGVFDDTFYSDIKEAFSADEIMLYANVRRPDYWLQSSYLQALKNGESRRFDLWLEDFFSRPLSGSSYIDVIDRWVVGLEAEGCVVRTYEWLLQNDVVLTDILSVSGCDIGEHLDRPENVVNPSPGPDAASLLLKVNQSNMDADVKAKLRKLIMAKMEGRKIGSKISFLSAKERLDILHRYTSCNQNLVQKYAREIGYPLFKEPWPDQHGEV